MQFVTNMDAKNFVPNNTTADLHESWHIPRPTLARSSKSSEGSNSTNSTHSARSGSLLLTAANLALVHKESNQKAPLDTCLATTKDRNLQYYVTNTDSPLSLHDNHKDVKTPDPDSVSLASSTHFTVVNMNTRPQISKRSFCRKHQLTILVVTMSVIFTCGILAAILFMELRARRQQY